MCAGSEYAKRHRYNDEAPVDISDIIRTRLPARETVTIIIIVINNILIGTFYNS